MVEKHVAVIEAVYAVIKTLIAHLPEELESLACRYDVNLPPPGKYALAMNAVQNMENIRNSHVVCSVYQYASSSEESSFSYTNREKGGEQSTFIAIQFSYNFQTTFHSPGLFPATAEDKHALRGYLYVAAAMAALQGHLCCENPEVITHIRDFPDDYAGVSVYNSDQEFAGVAGLVVEVNQTVSVRLCGE